MVKIVISTIPLSLYWVLLQEKNCTLTDHKSPLMNLKQNKSDFFAVYPKHLNKRFWDLHLLDFFLF